MGKKEITYQTHHHEVAPAYPQTVHNYAAPTADTAKLLRELEAEAWDSVVDSFVFSDNELNGVVIFRKIKAKDFQQCVFIKYTFNGKTYSADIDFDPSDLPIGRERAAQMLWDRLSKTIAADLFPQILQSLAESAPRQ